MNTNAPQRLAAAITSVVLTLMLFSGVVSIAQSQAADANVAQAQAQAHAATRA